MTAEIYSYTSNIAKLLKHLPELKDIQKGIVSPIMIHTIVTHKCQLNCAHCCFKNRKNKKADMPFVVWTKAISDFARLGVKALEFTGGGDPVLWEYINEGIEFARNCFMKLGMITNGIGINKVEDWNQFEWVRVSLNTLDYRKDLKIDILKKSRADISFCYIWNEHSDKNIKKIIDYANKHEIVCRLAPDCIKPVREIAIEMEHIKNVLESFPDNKYVLLSDFNIDFFRPNDDCRIHMIKPCLYLDGYLYACPSAELAFENDKQISSKTRICKYDEIFEFYRSKEAIKKREYNCSYCKYVKQQAILDALLMNTIHNDFA
jgi:MoaA/NifB/PqqE/SkfB family radical SAM enzyme